MRIASFRVLSTLVVGLVLVSVFFLTPNLPQEEPTHSEIVEARKKAKAERKALRADYLEMLYRDPATGQIPVNIRARETSVASGLPKLEDIGFKSAAASYDWKEAGPGDVGGRTRALAVDDGNAAHLLAGGASGGIWRSTDSGASWRLVSESHLAVTSISQDVTGASNVWYASTGELSGTMQTNSEDGGRLHGTGIYKSTDSGASWAQIQDAGLHSSWDTEFDFVSRIVVNPQTGSVFFAENSDGIFRSRDGGANFEPVYGTPFEHGFSDIAVQSGVIVAVIGGMEGDSANGVYVSQDDGDTWSPVHDGAFPEPFDGAFGRPVLALSQSNPDVAYIMTYMDAKVGRSGVEVEDVRFHKVNLASGEYEDRSDNLPLFLNDGALESGSLDTQGGYNMTIAVQNTDENMVFIGGTSLFRSRDGFATPATNKADVWIGGYATSDDFSSVENNHPDQHALVFDQSNANRLYAGHDGGLSVADDATASGPISWRTLNHGYNVTQFFHVALARAAGDNRVLGGTQDNGSPFFRFENGTASASADITTGDGATSYLGQQIVIGSSQNGNLNAYEAAPETNISFADESLDITPCSGCGQLFVNPFAVDYSNESIVYYPAGASLWRADLSGNGWSELGISLPGGYGYSALAVSTVPSSRLYTAAYSETGEPKLYRMDDAQTATTVTNEISIPAADAGAYVLDIGVNPLDADELLVTISNYGVVSLFHSSDAGASWSAVEGNLAGDNDDGSSVRAAEIMPGSEGTSYWVGTSTGLYTTTELAGGATAWTRAASSTVGMTAVAWIDGRSSDGTLAVATHGRGIFIGTTGTTGTTNSAPVASNAAGAGIEDGDPIAVTLQATDADGDALSFALSGRPQNGSASIDGTGLSYTPAADFFGQDQLTFTASDNNGGTSQTATVTLTIAPVNDAPSFTAGRDQSIGVDAGPQTVTWASDVSAGPANEAGQALAFVIAVDDPALFSAQPAISSDGVLSYTTAQDAAGVAVVSVTLMDDGGTENGGVDTSPTSQFSITISQGAVLVAGSVTFSLDMNREIQLDNLFDTDILGLRGTVEPLHPENAVTMTDAGAGVFTATVEFLQEAGTEIEYDFVIIDPVNELLIEEDLLPSPRSFVYGGTEALPTAFWDGIAGVGTEAGSLPKRFALRGNYPNPFNPSTSVVFDLDVSAIVQVHVLDMLGRLVHEGPMTRFAAGAAQSYSLRLDNLPSGNYVYRVSASAATGRRVSTGTLTLLK